MREEVLRITLHSGLAIDGPGIVGQATSLAHLLEYNGIHATAEILVEQRLHWSLFHIPLPLLVVIHPHIDVLGIVGSNENLALRCSLTDIGLVLRDIRDLRLDV